MCVCFLLLLLKQQVFLLLLSLSQMPVRFVYILRAMYVLGARSMRITENNSLSHKMYYMYVLVCVCVCTQNDKEKGGKFIQKYVDD